MQGGKKVANQNLDTNEEIEIVTMPLEEVKELFLKNKIKQSLHSNCIFYALKKMEKIWLFNDENEWPVLKLHLLHQLQRNFHTQ